MKTWQIYNKDAAELHQEHWGVYTWNKSEKVKLEFSRFKKKNHVFYPRSLEACWDVQTLGQVNSDNFDV